MNILLLLIKQILKNPVDSAYQEVQETATPSEFGLSYGYIPLLPTILLYFLKFRTLQLIPFIPKFD